jgi:hypothetical protein
MSRAREKKDLLAYPVHPGMTIDEKVEAFRATYENQYALNDHNRLMLSLALDAYRRMLEAGEIVERDGLLSDTEKGKMPHVNPALLIEKEARIGMLKALAKMGGYYERGEN